MAITESRFSFITSKPTSFKLKNSFKKSPLTTRLTYDHDYEHEILVATEEGKLFSPEQAARVAVLKTRFAKTILKAQGILNAASSKKATSTTTTDHHHDQVDGLKVDKPENLIVKKPTQRPRNHHDDGDGNLLMIKNKKRSRDQADYDDRDRDCELVKKKRSSTSQADEDDHELMKKKSKQDIEREREVARVAINNITKTVDIDNLSVMAEFEKLLGSN